jgi:hypothetical protein
MFLIFIHTSIRNNALRSESGREGGGGKGDHSGENVTAKSKALSGSVSAISKPAITNELKNLIMTRPTHP